MVNNNRQIALPLLLSSLLIAGLVIGNFLAKKEGAGFFGNNHLSTYQQVIELIRSNYVDPIDLDSLQGNTIQDLLKELDPHSYYLTAAEVQESSEQLSGHFEGIGVEFNIYSDTATLIYIFPNGPGEKAGLLPGDKLLSVNGYSLTKKGLSADSLRATIKGKSGSIATLGILRKDSMYKIPVTRGAIPLPAVQAAYMLQSKTGYIRIEKFSETAYEEFMKNLELLKKNSLENLVIDLRGNGGGLLAEAVDIADELIDNKKLLVYTKGDKIGKKEYRAERPGLFEKGKVCVLIDEFSASASEVVAGCVQDWCRGKIIGHPSFGKGLVQQEYTLKDGAAVRLTVARYYTPLGRCIQQPYGKSDSIIKSGPFVNPCKDTLRASNGISPDILVTTTQDTVLFQSKAIRKAFSLLTPFCFKFYTQWQQEFQKLNDPHQLLSHSLLQNQLEKGWQKWVSTTLQEKMSSTENNFLKERMLATLARFKWRENGFYQILNSFDPVIKEAINVTH